MKANNVGWSKLVVSLWALTWQMLLNVIYWLKAASHPCKRFTRPYILGTPQVLFEKRLPLSARSVAHGNYKHSKRSIFKSRHVCVAFVARGARNSLSCTHTSVARVDSFSRMRTGLKLSYRHRFYHAANGGRISLRGGSGRRMERGPRAAICLSRIG